MIDGRQFNSQNLPGVIDYSIANLTVKCNFPTKLINPAKKFYCPWLFQYLTSV